MDITIAFDDKQIKDLHEQKGFDAARIVDEIWAMVRQDVVQAVAKTLVTDVIGTQENAFKRDF